MSEDKLGQVVEEPAPVHFETLNVEQCSTNDAIHGKPRPSAGNPRHAGAGRPHGNVNSLDDSLVQLNEDLRSLVEEGLLMAIECPEIEESWGHRHRPLRFMTTAVQP